MTQRHRCHPLEQTALFCLLALLPSALQAAAPFSEFIDPNPSPGNLFGHSVVALSTGNVVITSPYDDAGGTDAGAAYLFNGVTGALISTVTGSTPNDNVGINGVVALATGNFVINTSDWNNAGVIDSGLGAVTFGNGVTGVSGVVSAANSLVGTTTGDNVGRGGVTALTNGNYVVCSSFWDDGTIVSAGAATFGNGTTGVVGPVTTANSLHGTGQIDGVGDGGAIALSNGNYVVVSYLWNGGRTDGVGAVTLVNGATGMSGPVTAANSLVGSTPGDFVGREGVTALSNGNFVVNSRAWHHEGAANAGAVTFVNGTTGLTGPVTTANSLHGTSTDDSVGRTVIALSNGSYVVNSYNWDNGGISNVGAVTFGNGSAGISGPISTANSLHGSIVDDWVGIQGVVPLSNGNYVVASSSWDNGSLDNAGAATWGSGTTGITGPVTTANSLHGTTANDAVGRSITPLSNGNYVVISRQWNNGVILARIGAATWGDGATGLTGPVTTVNSLHGSTAGDFQNAGVTALTNGNYVVSVYDWDNAGIFNVGAVVFGNGSTGIVGPVTTANSLYGTAAGEFSPTVIPLTNGNYVVSSVSTNVGAVVDAGTVTFGNGTTGITGTVTASNSLHGRSNFDLFGLGINTAAIKALSNGNYVIPSRLYSDSGLSAVGAFTFGNGTTGSTGPATSSNSLFGQQANTGTGLRAVVEDTVNGTFYARFLFEDNGKVRVGSRVTGFAPSPEIAVVPPTGTTMKSTVVAWGSNVYGQSTVPSGLGGVSALAMGERHSLALRTNGTVAAWGENLNAALNVPVGLTGVTAIASGVSHNLALKSDGTIVAWGFDSGRGETLVPAGLSAVKAISAGFYHSVALKTNGTVVAWGQNNVGQSTVPIGLTGVAAIASGGEHVLALKSNGTVVAWGFNSFGQTTVPSGLTGVTAIAAGLYHSMALKSDGTVVVWGSDNEGQSTVPSGLTGVVAIAAGMQHCLALKSDGSVVAWGLNDNNQTTVPTSLREVRGIASGVAAKHNLALAGDAFDFGSQTVAIAGAPKTFTIKNTGPGVLDVSSVAIVGANAADFTLNTTGLLTSVPATTGTTTLTVAFTPSAAGLREATLRIVSNDDDESTFDLLLYGHGVSSPLPTISNIANTTIVEDTVAKSIAFTIGDVGTPAALLSLSATSSNPALIPDASITFGGSGTARTVLLMPLADAYGTSTITVTVTDGESQSRSDSFVLTVTPVADTPSITSATTAEDMLSSGGLVISRSAVDGSEVTHFKITAITNGTLFQSNGTTAIAANAFITFAQANAGLRFKPAANFSGLGSFKIQASKSNANAGLGGSLVTASITVTAANDVPKFTKGSNRTHPFGTSAAQTFAGWATAIDDGDPGVTQSLMFNVNVASGAGLFTVPPAISSTGTLTYQPNGTAGVASISVTLTDDASLESPALTTAAQTFTITVGNAPPNTKPTISAIAARTILEDTATPAIAFTVGDSQSNPGDLIVTASSNNLALVPLANITLAGAGSANRAAVITPAPDKNGKVTITLTVSDGLLTATSSFVLTVTAVNDAPTFVAGPDQAIDEDSPAQSLSNWATALSPGPSDEGTQKLSFTILSNSNPGLFRIAPAISSTGTLTYVIKALTFGAADITYRLNDTGGIANGGSNASSIHTLRFKVAHINHPPEIIGTGLPNQVLSVGGGAINLDLLNYFTDVDLGDLMGFSLVTNADPGKATVSITGSNMQLTPVADGTTLVTLRVSDDADPPASLEYAFTIIVGPAEPTIVVETEPRLNQSTGLLESRLKITNNLGRTLDGFRLSVTNLPAAYKLWNRTHATLPYIDYNRSVAPGQVIYITVEYFSPTRTLGSYVPDYAVTEIAALPDAPSAGGSAPVRIAVLADLSVLVVFATVIGERFQVEYSDDAGSTWLLSPVAVKAGATKINWVDRGPPYTATPPVMPLVRQYRLRAVRS